MIITISGPPGSGKSTVASTIATVFEFDHTSGGDIFRSLAAERDLSVVEFNELAENEPSIDQELDQRLREIARTQDDIVVESRLSGWMAGDYADLKVWLDAPLSVRAERIAAREDVPVAQAKEETSTREASEKKRYKEYYDIDFDDRSIYDLSVNTARWDPEAVGTLVRHAIELYDPAADEGRFMIDRRIDLSQ